MKHAVPENRVREAYRRPGEEKEQVILSFLPLIKRIAGKIAIGLPPSLEESDLIGSGIIGLLEAWERYDSSRGVEFIHYAARRIRGAMIDEVRKLSWPSRSFFPRLRQVQQAEEKLLQEYQREPSVEEIAAYLGWPPATVEQVWSHFNLFSILSLERWLFENLEGDGVKLEDFIAAPQGEPGEEVISREREKLLAEALEHLPPREQQVLALYYYEDLTQKEIAALLKISPARVSQLHARALQRLQKMLSSC
ncbi:MAG: FliA/WhiG family RNA polymerase sigma factor [Dethiobacteria bacterium]|nr:FliA/WhiG family RNA polymerase sigma factor [Bacillota bacterium]HQD05345.1 FliA/WhiG family RNA polymerase sigma factor [Bacillota bacterium]